MNQEPFISPKNISIDTDEKGLYFYIKYNLITGAMLMFLLFFIFNTITFGLLILGLFIKTIWNYYYQFILYLLCFGVQISLIVIIWILPRVITKFIILIRRLTENYKKISKNG